MSAKAISFAMIAIALVVLGVIMIFNHGYGVGKDIAEKENRSLTTSNQEND